MKQLWLIVLIPYLLLIQCAEPPNFTDQLQSCELIRDATVISKETRDSSCNYFNVYYYKNDIYRTCVCCLCNKAFFALNCDNEPLCIPFSPKCMDKFMEEAEYLFSLEDKG